MVSEFINGKMDPSTKDSLRKTFKMVREDLLIIEANKKKEIGKMVNLIEVKVAKSDKDKELFQEQLLEIQKGPRKSF